MTEDAQQTLCFCENRKKPQKLWCKVVLCSKRLKSAHYCRFNTKTRDGQDQVKPDNGTVLSSSFLSCRRTSERLHDSWEKVGLYDVSSTIDYILETTGYEKLFIVGHSMATTEFFVLCTLRPEYNNKVQHMVALGPVAYLTYSPSAFQVLAPIGDLLALILSLPMHGELLPRNSEVTNLLQYTCAIPANAVICENIMFSIYEGIDLIGFNQTLLPIIFGHDLSGTSVNTFLHFFQVVNSKRFQRFDYGQEKNLEVYNSSTPPEFNLSEISVPMSFFYGENDLIVDRKDLMNLVSQLKVQVDVYRVNLTSFNHIDYVYGKNLNSLVNDKVISILRENQFLTRRTVCGP